MLKAKRRYFIVIAFVIAAVLTPPDVLSQMSLAIPLLLLYEGSIWSVKIVEGKAAQGRRRRKRRRPRPTARHRGQAGGVATPVRLTRLTHPACAPDYTYSAHETRNPTYLADQASGSNRCGCRGPAIVERREALGPHVTGPARPKAATPGNRGPAVARGRAPIARLRQGASQAS